MTDITELALIAKIKKQLENFDTVVLKEDEANALVEALEKAQAKNALVAGGIEAVAKLHERIAELESRTVKLPKPHAHLIWIQAGHAPDDYWDDVAVSHSEKDRCCDGSERYPVYARLEIEEMLTAAGIKVEAD
ncbi:hypothetical protein [Klebsiella variicola]|uniref:hypothetical protein n=1 Tax=Klebsiella variicola TaxID=244366 RepID=UPI001CCAF1C1|nr:hypothetical protein [Klebsiella variicola]